VRSVIRFKGGEFHPNFKLGDDLRRQHQVDPHLARLANEAALGAREVALRVAFDQGDYFGSISGGLDTNRRGLAVGRVVATDFKALWIERGHRIIARDGTEVGRARPKNVLARGARRAGLRFRRARVRTD
jgi:hypothetical protein